jgi:DNA-binding MarR family transcriptional regulator
MSMIDTTTISSFPGSAVFARFWQTRRAINLAASHELKPLGVGLKQALIIFHLDACGKTSHAELARFTSSDPAAIGRALDALIRQGWLAQQDNPSDRRRWDVRLTPRGKALARSLRPVFQRLTARFARSLGSRDARLLSTLLDKIICAFSRATERKLP